MFNLFVDKVSSFNVEFIIEFTSITPVINCDEYHKSEFYLKSALVVNCAKRKDTRVKIHHYLEEYNYFYKYRRRNIREILGVGFSNGP